MGAHAAPGSLPRPREARTGASRTKDPGGHQPGATVTARVHGCGKVQKGKSCDCYRLSFISFCSFLVSFLPLATSSHLYKLSITCIHVNRYKRSCNGIYVKRQSNFIHKHEIFFYKNLNT